VWSVLSLDSLANGWAKALSVDKKHFNMFFEHMTDGFAYQKIVLDESGKPVDYVFLEVNNAFEKITGFKREEIIGKKVTEVLKGIENDPTDWIGKYGKVALTCQSIQFENYVASLGKWYNVSAYCPDKGYFVALFEDITERKKAEAELKSTFTRFYDSLSSLHGAILLVSADGHVEFANQSFSDFFGLKESPKQLKGLTSEEIIAKVKGSYVDSEQQIKRISAIVSTGKPVFNEEVMLVNGRTYLRDFIPLRVEGNQGSFSRLWHHTDITQQKVALKAVSVSEDRFRSVLNNSLDVVYRFNLQTGHYEYMSPASKTMLGYEPQELMDMTNEMVLSHVHPNDLPALRKGLAEVNKTGKGIAEYRFRAKDGKYVWWSNQMVIIKDKDGTPLYRDGFVRNITGNKQAERALRESEQRWSTTLSSIGDAVIATDIEGKISFMNVVAEKITGWTSAESLGKPVSKIFNIINEETRKPADNPVFNVLQKGCVVGLANHTLLICKSGVEIPIDDSGAPIKTSDGKTIGVVLVFRDISERKLNEAKLLKVNRTLRAISNTNQALIRSINEVSFLQQACKIIVEDCGYKMVWVGLAEDNPEKTVRPVAYAGFDAGYIEALNVTWADLERGRGPTGTAIRTGKIQICNDMRIDPAFKPWRDEALKRGYVSSIALPLKSVNRVLGALMIYSSEQGAFLEDEIKLLSELADDFAQGVNMLRLRAEKEKAENQIQRQANLIDLSPDAIIVRGLDGEITFWSTGAEKLYGWTKKEAIGKTTHELFQTKYHQSFKEIIAQLNSTKHWAGELVHKTKSGKEVTVQSWWLAEKTEHGKITSILESNVDLTERKKAELEIERLASFPLLNPNPVIEVDFDGKLTFVNPATKMVFPDLEAAGIKHYFFNEWDNLVKEFSQKKMEGFSREIKIGEHWYHQQFYFVPKSTKLRVYCTDIDELKQTEQARIKIQEKLEENAIVLEEYANQMEELAEQRAQQLKDAERLAGIGQTAGMVGHDIRNPLQAITSDMYLIGEEAKAMAEGDSKQSILESIESVNENLIYINKIVSDLQDYTRTLQPFIQDADLLELIEGAVTSIILPKRIEVATQIQAVSRPIRTDATYLRRILTNLITNGVQAMPNGGKLTIKASNQKNKTVIAINDTGVGIPEEVKTKMFTPLFTTKSKGQGLGLAVVKRLVDALGGNIKFESQENKGTTFIVELPKNNVT
jgi:PAS domain S-box-containing protein